jgi:hypothetical protein
MKAAFECTCPIKPVVVQVAPSTVIVGPAVSYTSQGFVVEQFVKAPLRVMYVEVVSQAGPFVMLAVAEQALWV